MQSTVINNQTDFEKAFLQGHNDIRLAAGHYKVPMPSAKGKIYMFKGSITGCGDGSDDVVLDGSFGANDYLTLKNLTLNNTTSLDSLVAFQNSLLKLQNVNIIQRASANCCPLRCDDGASLVADNIKVDCDPWKSIECYGHVQVVITNSKLQGLNLQDDGGSMVLNNVSLGEFLINGKWSIATDGLNIFDHPNLGNYIDFNKEFTSKHKELEGRKWLFYNQYGTVTAHDLKLPDELAAQVIPLGLDSGQLLGNIVESEQRSYQPLISVDGNVQLQLKGATTTPLLNDTVPHSHDAVKELKQLIGLTTVKKQVDEFINVALMNSRRKKKGMPTISNSLHSLFEGNPGTGKTTVARLVGKIMYEEGILPTSNYVEVDRGDLVAGYVGQTAEKTGKVLEKATGGVLFIDEAYDLVHGKDDSFGLEALDTIMKYMEDHRDNLMIIFAGYTADMEELLKRNSGMKSRVPNVFTFEDYSAEEIAAIGRLQLRSKQMQFDQPNTEKLYDQLVQERYTNSNDHSNGRWIRNQNDLLLRQIAMAVAKDPDHPLDKILAEDITNAFSDNGDGGQTKTPSDDQKSSMDDHSNMPPMPPLNNKPLPFLNGDELK